MSGDDEIGVTKQNHILPVHKLEDALKLAFDCNDLTFLRKRRAKNSDKRVHPLSNSNQNDEEDDYEQDLRDRSYAQRFQNDSDSEDVRNIRNIFPSSDFRFSDE